MVKIEVALRSAGNYHAQIKDRPEIWAAGDDVDEAVGNLVRYHPEQFDIELEFIKHERR